MTRRGSVLGCIVSLSVVAAVAACSGSSTSGGSGGEADGGQLDSTTSGSVCAPGQQVSCACPGGGPSGVQVCSSDGQGYGPCTGCGGSSSGGSSSGTTSGSSGSSGGTTSSGSSSGTTSSGSSSGTTSSSSGSSSGTTSSSSGSSSGTVSDAGTDACTRNPPEIHASTVDGGIYCPFSFDDTTGTGAVYCANGVQQCCISPSGDAGPSTCVAFTNSTTPFTQSAGCGAVADSLWQCGTPTDCAQAGPVFPLADGGPGTAAVGDAGPIVCCLVGGELNANYDNCSGIESTHFGGTSCQPASLCQGSIPIVIGGTTYTDPLYTVCVTNADCPQVGQTCTAIYTTGTPLGVCLPQ